MRRSISNAVLHQVQVAFIVDFCSLLAYRYMLPKQNYLVLLLRSIQGTTKLSAEYCIPVRCTYDMNFEEGQRDRYRGKTRQSPPKHETYGSKKTKCCDKSNRVLYSCHSYRYRVPV